jgi:hypothetical protein
MINQAVQIAGSLLILIPFILALRGHLHVRGWYYLGANLLGSATLAVDAAFEHQWGFLLLESVWALVSGGTMAKIAIRGERDARPSRTPTSETPVAH